MSVDQQGTVKKNPCPLCKVRSLERLTPTLWACRDCLRGFHKVGKVFLWLDYAGLSDDLRRLFDRAA